jgi:hypothetical protein
MKYSGFVELWDCTSLAFAARAVSDDENRPQFWHMKVEVVDGGLLATATDGRRLHRAKIGMNDAPGLSPGFWRVLKNKKVKERDYETEDELGYTDRKVYRKRRVLWLAKLDNFDLFPSDDRISSIFPQGAPDKEGAFNSRYLKNNINGLIKTLPGQTGMNLKHLEDLGPYEWKYKIYSEREPVLFVHENKMALIMPTDLTYEIPASCPERERVME